MQSNLAYKKEFIEGKLGGIPGADIIWKKIRGKGRGVFACRDFKKGEIVETAPVVPLSAANVPEDAPPDGYVLEWDEETPGQEYAMALGYIMLYNHSGQPNLELECDLTHQTISAVALRPIKAGEELVWDYNCDLWFQPKK